MASTIYDNKKSAIDERYHTALAKAEDVYKKNVEWHKGMVTATKKGFWLKHYSGMGFLMLIAVLALGFLVPGIGTIVGVIGGAVIVVNNIAGMYLDKEALKKEKKEALENDEKAYHNTVANINTKYHREIQQLDAWYQQYQDEVKNTAKKYANGAEAAKLADRLAGSFSGMIDAVQNNVTVQVVDVTFEYNVYRDSISYGSYGTINFNAERLNPLTSDMQCEALARALFKFIKMNISTKYPQGKINLQHDDAKVWLRYTGVNTRYVAKRNF